MSLSKNVNLSYDFTSLLTNGLRVIAGLSRLARSAGRERRREEGETGKAECDGEMALNSLTPVLRQTKRFSAATRASGHGRLRVVQSTSNPRCDGCRVCCSWPLTRTTDRLKGDCDRRRSSSGWMSASIRVR